jgi:hypothetical protein
MSDPLSKAIERFENLVQALPDSELEREWTWGSYKSEGVRFAFFRNYEDLCQLAVQIAHARDLAGKSLSEPQRILAQYHASYVDLQTVMLGVESRYFEKPPAEGEWSLRRTLAHIMGAEIGFYVTIKFALERYRQGEDPLVDIDDETWLGIIGMEETELDAQMAEPLPGLQSFHRDLHQRILTDFAGIAEPELEYRSRFWEDEHYSLRFRLHRFDSHLRQHTIQIEKTLQALGVIPSESQRLLRLIYAALAQVKGMLVGMSREYDDLLIETAASIDERTLDIGQLLTL